MRFVKIFIKLALLVLLIMFFIQNSSELSRDVTFHLNFYAEKLSFSSGAMPLFFVVFLAFLLGALLMALVFTYEKLRMGRQFKKIRNELKKAEKELTALRQLPICNEREEAPKLPQVAPADPQ